MTARIRSFIERKKRQKTPGGCTYSMIEHDSIVLSRPYGYITKEVLEAILKQNNYHTNLLKKQNKPPLILTDLSKVTSVSAGVRGASVEINHFAKEKSALYGANLLITLIAKFVIRLSKVDGNTRIFRTRRQAIDWLQSKKGFPRTQVARAIAIVIALLGTLIVAGWYLNIAILRSLGPLSDPMNIVVGVNLIVVGAGLVLLTLKKALWKDTAVLVGAGWLVIFGACIILRSRFGINIPVDIWTLPAWFSADIPPCPEPIALLFALVGCMMLLATNPLVNKVASGIFRGVMGVSVLTIIGLLTSIALDITHLRPTGVLVTLFGIDATLALITYRSPGNFPIARRVIQRYGEGIAVFVMIFIITIVAWQRTLQLEESNTLNRTADTMTAKIDSNIDVLRDYRAFFRSFAFVDSSEFNRFFTAYELHESDPGLASMGLLQYKPNGNSYPITYVAPTTTVANYGVNLGADPKTRLLLERARDTGRIVSSDDNDNPPLVKNAPHYELLLAAALYDAAGEPTTLSEKRTKLRGFIVAEFDEDRFFDKFFNQISSDKDIPVVVTDVRDHRVLYRSPAARGNTNDIVSERIVTVADHSWSIGILKHNFGAGGVLFTPNIVFFTGAALGLLTALLVAVWVRRRQSVVELAEEITTDLETERNNALRTARKDDAILANIGDALFVIDEDGRITLMNDHFADLLGWKREEMIGRNVFEVLVATDAQGRFIPRQQRAITRVLRDNTKVTVSLLDEIRYRRKDGSSFPAAYTISPIEVDGKVTGAIEIIRDISQEAEVDQAKTQFISLASHQLRTPLTAAKWYSELLMDGEVGALKPAQEAYVEKVHGATIRTLDLVSSLLNLSRLEMGRIMVEPEPTNIVKLARGIVKAMMQQIHDRKLVVHQNYSTPSLTVKVDPGVVQTIIENLLSNAIKYSPEGATITLAIAADDHGTLISVKDTGYGIPKGQQGKVFTKLFRADNIVTKDTHGTGLGLALVKSLVEYTGGEIWFESVENEGSTFYVRIPPLGMKKKSGTNQIILVK